MSSRAQARSEPRRPPNLPERYRLRRHIASGGMASVWCADDCVLDRRVAIKLLADRFTDDPVAVRRFKREARAAARVCTHAHVVTVFDVGDLEPEDRGAERGARGPERQAFIVMEYLAGGTVADAIRVEAVRRQEALRWLGEAGSALDHAHQHGIVHRDIKPANFLLDQARVLHVADFGIASLVSEDTITSSDQLFGTAAYLSPEQALGRPATSASDRYALAVAAFELLAGERPFTATHFTAQARQHIEDEPPSASERNRSLPAAIDSVLQRGMAKEADARFATAGEFVDALQQALSESPTRATRLLPLPEERRRRVAAGTRAAAARASAASTTTRPRPPARARPPARRLGGRAIALAALLVVVLGVAAVGLGLGNGSSHSSAANTAPSTRALASAGARTRTTAQRPATPTTTKRAPSSNTTTTASAPPTAEQLQATGHQEMLDGNYETAIPTLRQAVSSSDPGSLTYAYALYDLGRSLVLGGDPNDAIPVLQQRLKIPNQTAVVRELLNAAMRAAGQDPGRASSPTPPAPGSAGGDRPGRSGDHGRGHAGPTGGAGLAPPSHGRDHAKGDVVERLSFVS